MSGRQRKKGKKKIRVVALCSLTYADLSTQFQFGGLVISFLIHFSTYVGPIASPTLKTPRIGTEYLLAFTSLGLPKLGYDVSGDGFLELPDLLCTGEDL